MAWKEGKLARHCSGGAPTIQIQRTAEKNRQHIEVRKQLIKAKPSLATAAMAKGHLLVGPRCNCRGKSL